MRASLTLFFFLWVARDDPLACCRLDEEATRRLATAPPSSFSSPLLISPRGDVRPGRQAGDSRKKKRRESPLFFPFFFPPFLLLQRPSPTHHRKEESDRIGDPPAGNSNPPAASPSFFFFRAPRQKQRKEQACRGPTREDTVPAPRPYPPPFPSFFLS